MTHRLYHLTLYALVGVLFLAALPYNPPPPRVRCLRHFRVYPATANEVNICSYTRATDSISAGYIPASVCDTPATVSEETCARYNRLPDYGNGNVWKLLPIEDTTGQNVVRGEHLHEIQCVDWKRLWVLCPRVFAEDE